MDDLFAAIQPSNDGGAGAPPAPEPPTPPVAEPPAPETPPADEKLSVEDQAEADEWDAAVDNLFPGLGEANKSKEDEKGEQPDATKKPEKTGEDKGADEKAKSDEEQGEPGEKGAEDDDGSKAEAAPEDEQAGRPELSPRDRQELETAVKTEIREKMFTEEINGKPVVTTPDGTKYFLDASGKPILADADGDPIKSIDDVMRLRNPRTGEAFTEEEAGMFLLTAQSQMRDNITAMNDRINEVASTGLTMKEDSETIAWEYGELLKAMPELTQELWAEYEKTLQKDPKTGIVIKAPVSLQKFYETALRPYADLGRRLEGQQQEQVSNDQAAADKAAADKAAAEERRKQARQDRSDIYGGGKVDDATDEDKEWGNAAQAVFGDQLKDLRR